MSDKKFNFKFCVLLPIVLAVTIFLWAVPTSFYGIDALTVVQQRVIALFVFAALMWMFEIIPNWTTSLLLIVLTLLTISDKGISLFCDPKFGTLVSYKSLMASFADPVVMLFMGGFVLAIMAEKYGLDVTLARIAQAFRYQAQHGASWLPGGNRNILHVYVQYSHRCHDACLPGSCAAGPPVR